jgi:imidazole glycerol-phosphate synthase subunit HisH
MASGPIIAVVDYDMGNLHSACKGLAMAGAETQITSDPEVLAKADAVVLPGVGAFDPAICHLRDRQLIQPLQAIARSGKPFLGICLGMQILFDSSAEGSETGLGILPGQVRRFDSEPGLTIPHMGWNQLGITQPNCPLWQGLSEADWMYFVHSFYVVPGEEGDMAASVTHGSQTVTAAVARNNVLATQFHPEKSSDAGLKILANFVAHVQAQVKAQASVAA